MALYFYDNLFYINNYITNLFYNTLEVNKMKRIMCLITAVMMLLLPLSSCANGMSFPYDILKKQNTADKLLSNDIVAYKEKIEYFSDTNVTSYEIYYEIADGFRYSYNICETIDDYSFMAHEGNVYTKQNGDMCLILFTNQALTYYGYIQSYLATDFPLDGGERFQSFSEQNGDRITVEYHADITPQTASEIYSVDLTVGEKIISTYTIDKDQRIYNIIYETEKNDGTRKRIAQRSFEYYKSRLDVFEELPSSDMVTLTLVINDKKFNYEVPKGVYVGLEDNNIGYTYYLDAEFTKEYRYDTYGKISDDISIFVKEK